MKKTKIRNAIPADLNACHALCAAPELKTAAGSIVPFRWLEGILREKQFFFVAVEGKKIWGFVLGERLAGDWAMIHLLVVNPAWRNKGIGKRLLKRFEKECRSRRFHYLATYGFARNQKTVRFFVENGFDKGSLCYELGKVL